MPISEDEERELKVALMRADITLKQKQAFWETPRNLVLIIGALVALFSIISGVLGYKIGQTPSQTIVIQMPATPGKS